MSKSTILTYLASRCANSERCRRQWPLGVPGERAELAKRNAFIESYAAVLFDGNRHSVILVEEALRAALTEADDLSLFIGTLAEEQAWAKRITTWARQARSAALAAEERDLQANRARWEREEAERAGREAEAIEQRGALALDILERAHEARRAQAEVTDEPYDDDDGDDSGAEADLVDPFDGLEHDLTPRSAQHLR